MIAVPEPTLTKRQWQALQTITKLIDNKGAPPTIMEVARALGLRSRAGAYWQINKLLRLGYIRKLPGPRGLVLIGREDKFATDLAKIARRANMGRSIPYTASELGMSEAFVKKVSRLYLDWAEQQHLVESQASSRTNSMPSGSETFPNRV